MPMTARAERHNRVHTKPTLAPQAIRQLRQEKLSVSGTEFARLIKVSENTIRRWEAGKVHPDPHSNEMLEHLSRLCDILEPSMPPASVAQWLERPNGGIDNFRPIDLIEFEYGRRRLRSLIQETGLQAQAL
jgi:DNA-binding transcriptional regulator YiaG